MLDGATALELEELRTQHEAAELKRLLYSLPRHEARRLVEAWITQNKAPLEGKPKEAADDLPF